MDIWNIFDTEWVPVGDWVEAALQWVVTNFRFIFQAIKVPFDIVLSGLEDTLTGAPDLLILAIIVVIAWQSGGRRLAAICTASLLCIGLMGIWDESMVTLSIVLTCVIFCSAIGIPLGIMAARSDRFWTVLRPLLLSLIHI